MHASQLVCPAWPWYVPPAHGVHCEALSLALNEPGAHGDGAVELVEQLLPAGHGVHCSALVRSVESEKVVAGQGSGAAAPSEQTSTSASSNDTKQEAAARRPARP